MALTNEERYRLETEVDDIRLNDSAQVVEKLAIQAKFCKTSVVFFLFAVPIGFWSFVEYQESGEKIRLKMSFSVGRVSTSKKMIAVEIYLKKSSACPVTLRLLLRCKTTRNFRR